MKKGWTSSFDGFKEITGKLTLSELNTMLLEVFSEKAAQLKASEVLRNYLNNRFVRPSTLDAVKLMKLRFDILSFVIKKGFEPIEISPLTVLGTSSVFAPVDQNNIVSANRGTEVVSDPTNVLALEAAVRRKDRNEDDVNLCCMHRAVRAQAFDNPRFSAHFELFCMVSAWKDTGNFMKDKQMAARHITLYIELLKKIVPEPELSIELIPVSEDGNIPDPSSEMIDDIIFLIKNYRVSKGKSVPGFTYYKWLRFCIYLHFNGEKHMIIDGGFTDWTQKSLNNKKERLLTSGLGVEHLIKIFRR